MTYKVRLSPHAARAYRKFDPSIRTQIQAAIDSLQTQPLAGPKIRRLQGLLHRYYRYRVGEYRVVYFVAKRERIVYVEYIQHRKEVYRRRA